MTKEQLKQKLEDGSGLNELFNFNVTRESISWKSDYWFSGDDIIYIPKLSENCASAYLGGTLAESTVDTVLKNCYTGQDLIELCGGNSTIAKDIFLCCNGQAPQKVIRKRFKNGVLPKNSEEKLLYKIFYSIDEIIKIKVAKDVIITAEIDDPDNSAIMIYVEDEQGKKRQIVACINGINNGKEADKNNIEVSIWQNPKEDEPSDVFKIGLSAKK